MSSLKTNVVFNFINTLTGILFPIITFPYTARILLPEGIGAVNFYLSIINYIVLLTSLGIPMYAVKEVAKYRDDIIKRNRITVEITLLSTVLCLLGYLLVWILASFVPQINTNVSLFYILSLTIIFTGLGVQWFYQAIEDFKFITIRAILVRSLATVSLFVFVRDKNDLLSYGIVTVASTVGNNMINFFHLRKYIRFSEIAWGDLRIIRHLKPALHIFILNLIISIYVNLNLVMLGFMQGDEAVGFYSAGVRIPYVILSVVTSLGVVMLPRCSNLVKASKMDEFTVVSRKVIRFVLCSSLPLTIGLMLLSRPIISIFCGPEYSASVPVLCLTAPIIVFIGVTNVIGIQILYPQNQENLVIWSTVGGAVFNFVLNLVLIPIWSYEGAAIATLVAEFSVLVIQLFLGRKYVPFSLFEKENLPYVTATLVMSVMVLLVISIVDNPWSMTIGSLVVGGFSYAGILFLLKDSLIREILVYMKLNTLFKR